MTAPPDVTEPRALPRHSLARSVFLAGSCAVALLCVTLGIWQLQRRAWKLDLIARVEARLAAAPIAAPGPSDWPGMAATEDEYRRVALSGHYLALPETLTMAVTERGPGFWVLAPFRTEAGFTVLVNRGFVPADRRLPEERRRAEATSVAGLLRSSEPGGGFLRANEPAAGRWYSRDVVGIAATLGLEQVAPFFVDADAASEPGPLPQGGMTQLRFRNTHLVYALTWFSLALMAAGAALVLLRERTSASRD